MSDLRCVSRRPAFLSIVTWIAFLVLVGCSSGGPVGGGRIGGQPASPLGEAAMPAPDTGAIQVTLIQLNDIYEITPVSGGRWGGPARVATVRNRLAEMNPNTLTLLAGDLFSPSALGTARVDGERLAGKQMVAVLNAMGLDYATFGNHEFDLSEGQFLDRLEESDFGWVSTNVTDDEGHMFPGVKKHEVVSVSGPDGSVFRLGFIGLCYDGINPEYVDFLDPIVAAREEVEVLRGQTDAIVAITHLPVGQDIDLAAAIPELDLIVGGHEHENMRLFRGENLTPIVKADANVRTLYIHDLFFDPTSGGLTVESRLLPITHEIPDDPLTAAIADQWVEVGFAGFREAGFEPWEIVAVVSQPLDGLEMTVRNRPTGLTTLIADAMKAEFADSYGALLNSGSIRIDDVIAPGPLTQYDVIRILPFGGPVLKVEMEGSLLLRVLEQGERNQGGGGYLQRSNLERTDAGAWSAGGELIQEGTWYPLAVADYLVSGNEQGFDFLNEDHPGLRIIEQGRDVRLALIDELKRRF